MGVTCKTGKKKKSNASLAILLKKNPIAKGGPRKGGKSRSHLKCFSHRKAGSAKSRKTESRAEQKGVESGVKGTRVSSILKKMGESAA